MSTLSANPYEVVDRPRYSRRDAFVDAESAMRARAGKVPPLQAHRNILAQEEAAENLPLVFGSPSAVGIAAREGSFIGALVGGVATSLEERFILDPEVDPDFDVWSQVDLALVEKFPFLMEDLESGRLGDIPNQQAFTAYLHRKEEQMKHRELFARAGWTKWIGAQGLSQIPDVLTGTKLMRWGLKLGVADKLISTHIKSARSLLAARSKAGTAARVGTLSGVNVFQELGIQWADPEKEVGVDQNVVFAAMAGLGFGAAVESMAPLFRKGAYYKDTLHASNIAKDIRADWEPVSITNPGDVVRVTEEKLRDILSQPVTGPRHVLEPNSDTGRDLVRQIQEKFDLEKQELIVFRDSPEDFFKFIEQLEILDGDADYTRAIMEFVEGKTPVGRAMSAAKLKSANAIRKTMDFVTPGGTLKRWGSTFSKYLHRVLYDESMPSVGAIDDPLDNFTPRSAEALKRNRQVERGSMVQKFGDAFDRHFRDRKGPMVYVSSTGEKIIATGRRASKNEFVRMVHDYHASRAENFRGQRDLQEVPDAVREASDALSEWSQLRSDQLYDVGLMSVSPQALKDLRAKLAETRRLASKTEDVVRSLAPGREAGDESIRLAETTFLKSLVRRWSKDLRLKKKMHQLDKDVASADRALKELIDERQKVAESEGITGVANPDEIKRLDNQIEVIRGLRQSRRSEFARAEQRDRFDTIELDELQEELDSLGDRVKELEKPTDATYNEARRKNQVKIFTRVAKKLRRASEREAYQAEGMRTAVDNQTFWAKRRWLIEKIRFNQQRFEEKLRADFDRFRGKSYWTGAIIDPDSRVLIPEVVSRMTRFDPDEMARRAGIDDPSELTEGQLRAAYKDNYDEYIVRVGEYRDHLVDNTVRHMLSGPDGHGIEDGFVGGNSLRSRQLLINDTEYKEFLDDNLLDATSSYDQQLAGIIASRKAIKLESKKLGAIVRENLDEDLSLDPEQVVRALKKDFDNKMKFADTDAQKEHIKKTRDYVVRIFERKNEELEGKTSFFGNPAKTAGYKQLFLRNFLRLPALAFMGKVTVSSMPDAANIVMYSQLKRIQIQAISEGIKQLAKLTPNRRGLEALAAGLDEQSQRWDILAETYGMPASPNWGRGLKGKILARTDATMDAMTKGLFRTTGMNLWNNVWKNVAARVINWEMYYGAARLSKAAKLVEGGMDLKTALHKSSLKRVDATRLNRLGINASNADEIVQQFRLHGTDLKGRAVTEQTTSIISPNYANWDNPDLIEAMTSAVNSEVDNLIVTPNLLSRPLFLTDPQFGLVGRVFHQFQSFAFAWGNQLAPIAGQRPGVSQAQFLTTAVFFGAISDAIHNHLSGRRSFSESAEAWGTPEKVMGMAWGAFNRAGLAGHWARPLAISEKLDVGIGGLLGNDVSSMEAAQALGLFGNLGPFADLFDRALINTLWPLADLDANYDFKRLHNLSRVAPWGNHLLFASLYRFTHDIRVPSPIGRGYGIQIHPIPTQARYDWERNR